MEIKLKRFISRLTIILVVAVLFGCKQESSLPNPSQQELLPAPTGVTVKTHADKLNTVTLTWQTGDEVAEYYWIYYSTTNSTEGLAGPQERAYGSSVKKGTGTCDIVLDMSGTYYFWVRAADSYGTDSGVSGFSEGVKYDFILKDLTVPANVKVKAHANKLNTVTVTWETGTGVAEWYWIYCSTTNNTVGLAEPQARAYSDLSVKNGIGTCDIVLNQSGTYFFWVKAANDYSSNSGASGFSAVTQYVFALKDLLVPTSVTVETSTDNTVTVTWQTGDEVAEYYWIYYSTTNDTASLTTPQKKQYSSSLWKGTGTCDIVLDKSGTYYFWVRAATGYDELKSPASDFSAPASHQFTFKELPAPTGVTVETHADKLNTVTLTWQTSDEVAEYYWIYYSTTNDTASLTTPQKREYRSSLWKGTGTCDIVLDKSGTYYFWVRAASDYSTEAGASTFSTATSCVFTSQTLVAPTNVKAEKYESASSGIKLSWDTTKAPYYHIYWAESNDSSTAKKLTSTSTNSDTIYESVYDLKKGTTYYFWVKSANGFSPADSDSDFSSVASFLYN